MISFKSFAITICGLGTNSPRLVKIMFLVTPRQIQLDLKPCMPNFFKVSIAWTPKANITKAVRLTIADSNSNSNLPGSKQLKIKPVHSNRLSILFGRQIWSKDRYRVTSMYYACACACGITSTTKNSKWHEWSDHSNVLYGFLKIKEVVASVDSCLALPATNSK